MQNSDTGSESITGITATDAVYWFAAFCISVAVAAYCFQHLDVPVAKAVSAWSGKLDHLASYLGGTILIAAEAGIVLLIVLFRHVRGQLSPLLHVLAIACITSICCYAINSTVLKCVFGVPSPGEVLAGAKHAFHFFQGTRDSGFPSGHMMLAGGFAGAFMYCYPQSRKFLSGLLAFGMCLLVAGNWHFISDVIIGCFLGVTGGLLAGDVWTLHISEIMEKKAA